MTQRLLIADDVATQTLVEQLRSKVSLESHLHLDSRQVRPGDIFVACRGLNGDGRNYIDDAMARGAVVVLVDVDSASDDFAFKSPSVDQHTIAIAVIGLKRRLAVLADLWYGRPSQHLHVVAVTGTNGKTTCVQWLGSVLNMLGYPAGVLGTLGVTFPDGHIEAGVLTTPDVLSVHRSLALLRAAGARYVALEASSIGIEQGRLDEVCLSVAAFTNLTHDHLDYHGDMESYEQAKRQLFDWPGLKRAVINIDDAVGAKFADSLSFKPLTYSLRSRLSADVSACDTKQFDNESVFTLCTPQEKYSVRAKVLGEHNISNLLCVVGILAELNIPIARIAAVLERLAPIDGRLQRVVSPIAGKVEPLVVVDYAHTPDALERALTSLRKLADSRNGELWCVFGCGGNRDAAKRPMMGSVVSKLADRIVVTSDNPRDESPIAIIDEILSGVGETSAKVRTEVNRSQAILSAVLDAKVNDVVLLAGKGHETYQDVAGVRYSFDDREWARAALLLSQEAAIQTDSRKLQAGEVFLALKGDNFDGHDYLTQVAQSGAIAAIVETKVNEANLPQVVLGETRAALLQLGRAWRRRFDIPVIAVTGSNGKTTTKEMAASILSAWHGGPAMLATQGNLNNELGVPLTLLRLRSTHQCAVVELGMNHPGEIAVIADATAPTVALVNNAQREHQEFMATVEAVARENGQVYRFLSDTGIAVFPIADEFTSLWNELSGTHRTMTFGLHDKATVYAIDIQTDAFGSRFELCTPEGRVILQLPVPGLHNVRNALAAAACCMAAGAPLDVICAGLSKFTAVKGRMQAHRLDDAILIDDTYNANPDSVRAAIDVLATLKAPTMLVLGDMGEVGDNGPAMHYEVGEYARERGINHLVTLGQATQESAHAFGAAAVICGTVEQALEAIRRFNPVSLLIKGSRFMRMERIVSRYLETHAIAQKDAVKHAV